MSTIVAGKTTDEWKEIKDQVDQKIAAKKQEYAEIENRILAQVGNTNQLRNQRNSTVEGSPERKEIQAKIEASIVEERKINQELKPALNEIEKLTLQSFIAKRRSEGKNPLESKPDTDTQPVLAPAAETTQPAAEIPPPPPATEQAEAVVAAQVQTDVAATTNPSQSELDSQTKLETAEIVDLSGQVVDERAENLAKDVDVFSDQSTVRARAAGLVPGAEKPQLPLTNTIVIDRRGNKMGRDLRVKLYVPPKYLEPGSLTSPLIPFGGIIFPYTPTISYEAKADYGASNPMHSNFPINFYQRSSTTAISINGKFTVQNTNDAKIYLATTHLLRSLVRMRSGGTNNGDKDSGAPPPVCRLDGYGFMVLDNVPVVITSYRVEMPDSVDYFTISSKWIGNDSDSSSVPTLSTIAIVCLPMYSREEMQKFSVTGYLAGRYKNKGFI